MIWYAASVQQLIEVQLCIENRPQKTTASRMISGDLLKCQNGIKSFMPRDYITAPARFTHALFGRIRAAYDIRALVSASNRLILLISADNRILSPGRNG